MLFFSFYPKDFFHSWIQIRIHYTLEIPNIWRGIASSTTTKCHRANFVLPDRNNSFNTLGLLYAVFVHMKQGALGLPVSVWLCAHSSVYSHLSLAAQVLAFYAKLLQKQAHEVLLVLQEDKLWKLSFAFCLLQELPMRCSPLNLVDSGDSRWGRLHGHIQTSCTFDSSHSRAGTKWWLSQCFLFKRILSAECEGSVTPFRTASNSLGAPEDT